MLFRTDRWQRLLTGMGMRPPMYLPLLTLTIYLFWRGYDYAISDQDEILPYLFHLLDPSLFQLDWLVNAQLETFGPRTLWVHIAWIPAILIGPYAAVLCIYVASWFGTCHALYLLSLQFTRERIAATLCVIVAMLMTPQFTLGGNDLVTWIYTPSMSAWTLSLWGLVFFVRGQTIRSSLLIGIGTWIQALVGLQMAIICAIFILWRHGFHGKRVYLFAGCFTLFALPALGPLIWGQLTLAGFEGAWSYFYVLFEFRGPHHYIPSSFALESVFKFSFLLGAGLATFRFLPEVHRSLVRRLMIIIGGLCVLAYISAEIWPVEVVTKLQLFKLTVLVKVFSVILLCNAIAKLILRFYKHGFSSFFDHGHYALATTVLLCSMLLLISPDALGIRPVTESAPEKVAEWARDSTDVNAVFAVPLGWDHFRSQARRAIVINFKAVPFHSSYMNQWFARLMDLAPIDPPHRGGGPIIAQLDQAFFSLTRQQILDLHIKYGFDYIVTQQETMSDEFQLAYQSGPWIVWRIKPVT
ncbi:MAG: hypothetical protein OXF84_06990 [Bacteroidetes bacterium]|nr:hypothetical protein [Bacteroidota bacterium]